MSEIKDPRDSYFYQAREDRRDLVVALSNAFRRASKDAEAFGQARGFMRTVGAQEELERRYRKALRWRRDIDRCLEILEQSELDDE